MKNGLKYWRYQNLKPMLHLWKFFRVLIACFVCLQVFGVIRRGSNRNLGLLWPCVQGSLQLSKVLLYSCVYRIPPFKRPRGRYILQKICRKTSGFHVGLGHTKDINMAPDVSLLSTSHIRIVLRTFGFFLLSNLVHKNKMDSIWNKNILKLFSN